MTDPTKDPGLLSEMVEVSQARSARSSSAAS